MAYIGGKCILKLVDRIGYGHWGGAGWEAKIRVFGTDAKLNWRHRQHRVHMEVHTIDRCDGATLEPIDTF